jgi:hypothetical protein
VGLNLGKGRTRAFVVAPYFDFPSLDGALCRESSNEGYRLFGPALCCPVKIKFRSADRRES